MFDSITLLEIFQIRDERSDKLWGRFRLNNDSWHVFWCAWNGSSSFKTHGAGWEGMISTQRGKQAKIKKGYKQVVYQDIIQEWPNFPTMMLERFTWHILQTEGV